jgi:glycosyltransferase involved in cell wall biosynthesis
LESVRRRLLLTSYPPDGGVARVVIDLAEGALGRGWTVDLACPTASEQWTALADRDGARLHPLRGRHGPPGPVDGVDLALLVPLVRDADVVHAHSSKAGFLTRLAAALSGRRSRVVFSPHAWSFWSVAGARGRLYVSLERAASHWCNTILTVSAAEREAGLQAGIGAASQYRVIHNGIDLERFAAEPSPVGGRVLFLGRLAPQKRPDLAIHAFAEVRRRRPQTRLEVAADGPLRARAEALVETLGLGDAVSFLGQRDDVPTLLARAQCTLLTSDYEGLPLAVLESMAAGVPVVATRVGGIPELVVDGVNGLLVPPGDPQAAAEAVGRLLDDPPLARRLGEAGRTLVRERHLRERMIAETTALYDALAG